MTDRQPEGTELAAQLGDAVGGPEVPADPETEAADQRRKLGEATRMAQSWAMEDGIRREDGLSLLAVLGDAALPVGAVLDRHAADLVAVEGAAAVLERRYPGGRDERLDTVLGELRALARVWRRMAAEAGKRTEGDEGQ